MLDDETTDTTEVAIAAYTAYGAVTDFKNYQGLPMPTWEELPETIQRAWNAAALEAFDMGMAYASAESISTAFTVLKVQFATLQAAGLRGLVLQAAMEPLCDFFEQEFGLKVEFVDSLRLTGVVKSGEKNKLYEVPAELRIVTDE